MRGIRNDDAGTRVMSDREPRPARPDTRGCRAAVDPPGGGKARVEATPFPDSPRCGWASKLARDPTREKPRPSQAASQGDKSMRSSWTRTHSRLVFQAALGGELRPQVGGR